MKRIINKDLTNFGLALTLVLLLPWVELLVAAQSIGRGGLLGAASGSIAGTLAGNNSEGDVGNNQTSGGSANFSADFRTTLGGSSDGSTPPNGDNNVGQQAPRSGLESSPSTAKPENFLNKMKDMFSGGSSSTSAPPPQQQNSASSSQIASNFTEAMKSSDSTATANTSASTTSASTTTVKPEGMLERTGNNQTNSSHSPREGLNHIMESPKNGTSRSGNETNTNPDEGIGAKLLKAVGNKGSEFLKESGNKFESMATEMSDKLRNATSGIETNNNNATSRGADHNNNNKNMTQSMKDFINNSRSKGDLPKDGSRNDLKDDNEDGKNVMVELFDKAHELSKMPMETLLKPLDKLLGVDKDPLLRMMDTSHNVLRGPLDMLTKPMDSILDGAFRTSDELEKEQPEQSNKNKTNNAKNGNHKKSDRSLIGEIADKTLELAESPFELVLKPIDRLLGNSDRKNPLLRLMDEIYGISKKPVDMIAKPFEDILKKMADRYEVSVEDSDMENPKIVTRLADGALNVADRVVTKPIEIVMRPWNRILGNDDKNKKNSIVEATHAWKNATTLGLELLTKPIDRIIKEIADLGDIKDEEEREEEYKRRREEASRLVELFDKIHHLAQTPFEIVLRPINKIFGHKKKGHKQAVLRAWDLLHYVLRVPIQVFSKPVEDAILGERIKKQGKGGPSAKSSGETDTRNGLFKQKKDRKKNEEKKNFFVDNIKKAEKLAIKPLELLSLPMRKLILGNHDKKNKSKQHGQVGPNANGSSNNSSSNNDTIVSTIEKMNNVLLTPIELLTQPIADTLFSKNGADFKIDAKVSANFIPRNSSSTTTKPSQQASTSTSTNAHLSNSNSSNNNKSEDKKDDKSTGVNAAAASFSTQG